MQQKNTSIESLSLEDFFEEFKSNLHQSRVCENLSDCFGDEYKKPGTNSICITPLKSEKQALNCRALKTYDSISYAVCYDSVSISGYTAIQNDLFIQGYGTLFDYFYFIVDLNGKSKPNVGGHDYYTFGYMPKYGVIPGGTGYVSGGTNNCQGYAADVLKTDKLPDD